MDKRQEEKLITSIKEMMDWIKITADKAEEMAEQGKIDDSLSFYTQIRDKLESEAKRLEEIKNANDVDNRRFIDILITALRLQANYWDLKIQKNKVLESIRTGFGQSSSNNTNNQEVKDDKELEKLESKNSKVPTGYIFNPDFLKFKAGKTLTTSLRLLFKYRDSKTQKKEIVNATTGISQTVRKSDQSESGRMYNQALDTYADHRIIQIVWPYYWKIISHKSKSRILDEFVVKTRLGSMLQREKLEISYDILGEIREVSPSGNIILGVHNTLKPDIIEITKDLRQSSIVVIMNVMEKKFLQEEYKKNLTLPIYSIYPKYPKVYNKSIIDIIDFFIYLIEYTSLENYDPKELIFRIKE